MHIDYAGDRLDGPTLAHLRRWLPACAARVAHPPHFPPDRLTVAVVGDAAMTDLHVRFLGVDGPTDVLTFEHEYRADGSVCEGEVVVCLDEALRRSGELGHPVGHELLLYALHGLLHLSGYDDRTPEGFSAMHAREDEILEAVGVGRVFTRPERDA